MSRARLGPLSAWWIAARPRTLPVSAAPVVVGSAVALADDVFRAGPAVSALIGALGLQLASNFANDLFDFEKGADTSARIGPPRATQLGLLTPAQMRGGIAAAIAVAVLAGLHLTAVAGWPVVAVGLLSIAAALAYTGGPWPFGYKGLGDPAVFLFFGVIAVCGTYFVQAGRVSMAVLFASLPVGALATAILVVNNVRDVETDAVANKRTLPVRFGRGFGRAEYALLVGAAFALPFVFWLGLGRSPFVLLPLVLLPRALSLVRTVTSQVTGPALNEALAGTAQLVLGYSLLLACGWLV